MLSYVTDDFVRNDFQNIEMNGLAKWSAFTDHNNVSFLDCKSWWAVNWDVSVSLFVSVVLWNVVKIISSDDNGSLHFCWDADSLENFTSDGNVAGEWTFFINIGSFNGLFGSFESKPNIFDVSDTRCGLFGKEFFTVQEDGFLFLEWSFGLNVKKGLLDCQPCSMLVKIN